MSIGLGLTLSSCSEDFLEPELKQNKSFEEGLNNETDLHNFVKGAYDIMNTVSYYGRDFLAYGDLRSDNCYNNEKSGRFVNPGRFSMIANDGDARDTWAIMYQVIAQCNIAINSGLQNNTKLDQDEIKYYVGQAHALRALVYFDLNRLYGQRFVNTPEKLGLPLVTEFNKEGKAPLQARATLAQTDEFITNDFKKALELMQPSYDNFPNNELSIDAVKALLARHYLYIGENAAARDLAYEVMGKSIATNWATDASLYQVMWKNKLSTEALFELAFSSNDNLGTTSYPYMWDDDGYGDFNWTSDALNIFTGDDVRNPIVADGTRDGEPVKYPQLQGDNNIRIIGYPEVFLTYAEAALKAGDINGDALNALNAIPGIRKGATYTALTLENVLRERRKELMNEGHRSYDLLRNGLDIPRLTEQQAYSETIPYGDSRCIFPIPERERDANKLIEQNPGY